MPAPETFDPALQTENIAFSHDELIPCDACGRVNAPNRLACIYCGETLNIRPDVVDKISTKRLDPWAPGTNIVITSADGEIAKGSELLNIPEQQFRGIIESGVRLPVARLDDKETAIISERLRGLGFEARSVPDSELAAARPPTRLASMRFGPDGFTATDLNTRQEHYHRWDALRLLVKGVLSTCKIDSNEKRGLRRTTPTAETVTSSDEPIVDIYTADDAIGYRVQLSGFDYSCLGADMSPLATENISRLVAKLVSSAPDLKVADYRPVRHLLTGIWDIEERRDPKGLQQVGFGKREFGMVHSTSNVEQFTRFSRLQRLML